MTTKDTMMKIVKAFLVIATLVKFVILPIQKRQMVQNEPTINRGE